MKSVLSADQSFHGNKYDFHVRMGSDNACKIYNMQPSTKSITLVKEDFQVPSFYEFKKEQVVPMYANEVLPWKVL